VADAESFLPTARFFVERVRRQGEIFSPEKTTLLAADDVVAVVGRTEAPVQSLGPSTIKIADAELLHIPMASFDLYVTQKTIAANTLSEICLKLQFSEC